MLLLSWGRILGRMSHTTPRSRAEAHVVVAGGGVAGLEATLALNALAPSLADVELVAPEHHFWYRPLAVAEPFAVGRVLRFELGELATAAGAFFTPGSVAGLDPVARTVALADGRKIEYDALVLALGATPRAAIPGAFTFRGPADTDAFRALLDEVGAKPGGRLVFVVPPGTVWPLPLYELALMTAAEARERGSGLTVELATTEEAPLELFGETASAAVADMLVDRGIELHAGRYAVAFEDGELRTLIGDRIRADAAVALPRLEGPKIEGVPRNGDGFVPTDVHGRVSGLEDVYAAGDLTAFPVKQGGVAAQQADAVAEALAARLGAPVQPNPFSPVLRGLLLTGDTPAYLRAELGGGRGSTSVAATEALWWPPGKIVGRYLAPFLAGFADVEAYAPVEGPGVLPVEIELAVDANV